MPRTALIFWITCLLWAGLGPPNASGAPQEDASKMELKALAGTWRPIAAENNGYKASEADLKGTVRVMDPDGRWTSRRGDETVVEWTVKNIDATKHPKTMDIEVASGVYKGVVYLAIYELEGDTLRICFAMPDKPVRPTDFFAGKGTVRAFSEFRRERAP